MKKKEKRALVLFSGGIDSSACIHYYKKLGYIVTGLFVNYGQKAYEQEKLAVESLAEFFNIKIQEIYISSNQMINNGIIQGRNNLLLSIAFMNFQHSNGLISLGIHAGTHYPDCSKEFIQQAQSIVDLYSNGSIIIDCPFIEMNKREIFEYCLNNNIPLNRTYSCENGSKQPCGKCSSCKDLLELYEIKN